MESTDKIQDQQGTTYQIVIKDRLDDKWTDWLNGIQIEHRESTTIITGEGIDQSRLRGILGKLWDLNITVISVNQLVLQQDKKELIRRR